MYSSTPQFNLQHSNVRHCVLLFIDNIWANLFITVYLIHFLQVAGVLLTMKKFMFILTYILWFSMHGVYWWNKYFSSKMFYQQYQSIIKRNSNISTIRKWMSSSINIQMKCEKNVSPGGFHIWIIYFLRNVLKVRFDLQVLATFIRSFVHLIINNQYIYTNLSQISKTFLFHILLISMFKEMYFHKIESNYRRITTKALQR